MALPDFLIAGVPKAGTTALHAALVRHPRLFLPPVKEPKFFLSNGPPPAAGGPGDVQTYQEHVWRQDDYEALFDPAPPGALLGEATPFYLYDHGAHDRIAKLLPDARRILLLRDPVDRAHSNWTHLWNAGLEPEADFLAACHAEPRRPAAGWAPFWHYVGLGRYGEQVRHLFQVFPRDQVLLLRDRDLEDAPAATLDRVCAFLGVPTGVLASVPRENVNRHVVADNAVNRVLRAGGRAGHRFPVPVRRAARGPLLTVLHRTTGSRPVTTARERAPRVPVAPADRRGPRHLQRGRTLLGRDLVHRGGRGGQGHVRCRLAGAPGPGADAGGAVAAVRERGHARHQALAGRPAGGARLYYEATRADGAHELRSELA